MFRVPAYIYSASCFRESLTKLNERINSLTKLKDSANNAVESLFKTLKEIYDDLTKSTDAFAKLGTENESILATKSRVDSEIEKESQLIEDQQRQFETAKKHSDELREQVKFIFYRLDIHFTNSAHNNLEPIQLNLTVMTSF